MISAAELALFLMSCWGMTLIVTKSYLFSPIRDFFSSSKAWLFQKVGKLLNCPMCFGFWSGLFFSLLIWKQLNPFAAGCAASGFCWVVYASLHYLGADEL